MGISCTHRLRDVLCEVTGDMSYRIKLRGKVPLTIQACGKSFIHRLYRRFTNRSCSGAVGGVVPPSTDSGLLWSLEFTSDGCSRRALCAAK